MTTEVLVFIIAAVVLNAVVYAGMLYGWWLGERPSEPRATEAQAKPTATPAAGRVMSGTTYGEGPRPTGRIRTT